MSNFRESADKARDNIRDAGDTLVDSARDAGRAVNRNLKAAGVDTDAMMEAAKDKAGELQEMIAAEIRRRPFHAVALAAFAGFWFALRR